MRTSIPTGSGSVADESRPTIAAPVARSPIVAAPPTAVVDGWEVSRRRAAGPLTLADRTPVAKVLVRADPAGAYARATPVPFGGAARVDGVGLVIGSGVGEWLLLGRVGSASELVAAVEARAADALVSAIDLTHGRALVRLTGDDAPAVLSRLCAIDLADHARPDHSAFRSWVAKVVTDVVRDDLGGTRSYLLHCERSTGQYLFDALLDAGADLGLEVDGFADDLQPVSRGRAPRTDRGVV
jgi:sarcosine oxidase subunit gamma